MVELHKPEGYRIEKYWDVPVEKEECSVSDSAWQEKIDNALRRSVQAQLVSDVPLGSFLSGGVDSSLISAMSGDIQTFSIGFDDPTYSELDWSNRVAKHLNLRHETEVITPNIAESFDFLCISWMIRLAIFQFSQPISFQSLHVVTLRSA